MGKITFSQRKKTVYPLPDILTCHNCADQVPQKEMNNVNDLYYCNICFQNLGKKNCCGG